MAVISFMIEVPGLIVGRLDASESFKNTLAYYTKGLVANFFGENSSKIGF
jgi:hypothetical protein